MAIKQSKDVEPKLTAEERNAGAGREKERRRAPRRLVAGQQSVRLVAEGTGIEIGCTLLDISADGLSVASRGPIRPAADFALLIGTRRVAVTIVWGIAFYQDTDLCHYGLQAKDNQLLLEVLAGIEQGKGL